ncbi:MAG: hypothetical protein R2991_10725 [Thermoanaerobaculia bacterium]
MTDAPRSAPQPAPQAVAPEPEFELLLERRPVGLIRRFFTTQRHLGGILFGLLSSHVASIPERRRHGLLFRLRQLLAACSRPFLDRRLLRLPFPVQLRKRLETLGPTYIKLGQIMSLREDLLPSAVTEELKNLLDRLPALPPDRFLSSWEELGRPLDELFSSIEPRPRARPRSARSIARRSSPARR